MTLSVILPTYNYNARALVEDLLLLAKTEGVETEILVGDDASTCHTEWMKDAAALPGVSILRASSNLGRARTLNRLAETSQGSWVLIADCDAQVGADFSLQTYLQAGRRAAVVCGGLRHPAVNPNPAATLRYRYERAADRHRSAKQRAVHPYAKLSTFNLLVRRDVFQTVRFDETCVKYGYEDVLFGSALQRHGIPILHIDNPLVHMGLDDNETFLRKTETALHNLHDHTGLMTGFSPLLATAQRLQDWHLAGLFQRIFKLSRRKLRRQLSGKRPNLTLFSLYKLGYFLSIGQDAQPSIPQP